MKKVKKTFLFVSMAMILLSNASFTASTKRIYAEELTNENQVVEPGVTEQADTAKPSNEESTQGDASDTSQTDPTETGTVDSTETEQTEPVAQPEEPAATTQQASKESSPVDSSTTQANSTAPTSLDQTSATQESNLAEEDYNLFPQLLITELSPNSKGGGTDYYEYIELYNNSNQPMSLANNSFIYKYTDTGVEKPFEVPAVTIAPQQTMVYWFNNGDKTLADFNTNYGLSLTADQVVDFKDVFPGFANGGNRALVIKDQAGKEIISASFLGTENDNNGAGIEYKYPATGTEMEKYRVLAAPTPGTMETSQVPTIPVTVDNPPTDTVAPVVKHTPVTEGHAFSAITIEADITDNKAVQKATVYYKNEGDTQFTSLEMNTRSEDTAKYMVELPGPSVKADLTYYIEATDGTNTTKTEEHTIAVKVEEDTYSDLPLLITELSPNSTGAGTDYYEFIELYNNTNKSMSLDQYSFVYRYTDGSKADLPFQVPNTTVEPQKSVVLWFNNGDKTLAEFNGNYGLALSSTQVIEFKDIFPGFANTGGRALVITDKAGNEIVSASYLGTENDNNGNGIEYKFPASGTIMDKWKVLAGPTVGTIAPAQVPTKPVNLDEQPKDEEAPVITHTPVTESNDFTAVKVEAMITDNKAAPFATLYYKQEGEESYTSLSMNASQDDPSHFAVEIPGAIVESDITYYIEASDGTNHAKTDEMIIKVKKSVVDFNKLPAFLVTEVVPDSTNVGSADGYEFIEVYNNTDKDVNFKDYKLQYRYGTDPTTDVIWPSVPDDVVIPSKKTLVFWIINDQNTNKTVADFNENYGADLVENKDIVKIYSAGMANASARGLVVATNTKKELAVSYYYDEANVDDTQPNKGIVYKYPIDGSTKLTKMGIKTATPGTVEASQVPVQPVHLEEDTVKPVIENMTGVTEVDQKDNIHIVADASDDTGVKSVGLFYRTNTQSEFSKALLAEDFDDTMYHYTIYSPEIVGKKYVEYYFVVSDGVHEVTSDTYKITINSEYDNADLRLNVKNGDILSKEKVLKGTSKLDSPDKLKLFIDGAEQKESIYQSAEHEAYFAFEVSGVNTFFQNGVTMGDDILRIFDDGINNWDTITVPLDADRLNLGENVITVRAGNKASPFQLEESEENRDDFNIRNARLVLSDGTVLRDPAKSDPNKTYDMGDDGTYRPFEDFTFILEEANAPSKTYKWDTTQVSDGEHAIKVQDSNDEVSATVKVDNTAPVITTNMEDGKDYKGAFTIKAEAADEIAGVQTLQVNLDGEDITVPYDTTSSSLTAGEHILIVTAFDKVGNKAAKTIHFTVPNENPNKPELVSPADGAETPVNGNPALKVKVTDPTNDDLAVSFYKGFQYDASKTASVKSFKNAADTEPPKTMVPDGEQAFTSEDISLVSQEDQQYLVTDSTTQFPYQRYEVTVDDAVDETDLVELDWKGKSLPGRKVSMYAWNHHTNDWSMIQYKIAGQEDFELKGNVAVSDFVKDHKINVMIQDEIPTSPDQYDYTFVWMSDTQYYAESYPWIYDRMTKWIAEKQNEMKIKYVFHTGDIVDEADKEYQWQDADKFMKVLDDNNIPYGVLAGNHDVDHKTSDYTHFSQWFGEDRFKDKPYYGASYKNNRGHYDLISANGNDYIMLYMGWGVQDEDIQWMSNVLKQYPHRKAILNFHEYLLVSGNRSPLANRIYSQLVEPNKNVIAVLSGHYHDSETLIDPIDDNGDGVPDRQVYQMLGDYQGGPEGGQGYMKLLHFDQKNNKIIVNTYSPYMDDYNFYDPSEFPEKDERDIDVDLQPQQKRVATDYFTVNIYTDSEIGKVENVSSGSTTQTGWTGLAENQSYSWYAVAEDGFTGKAISDIWTFTKGKDENPSMPDPVDPGTGQGSNPDGPNDPGNTLPDTSTQGGSGQGYNENGVIPVHETGPGGSQLPLTGSNIFNALLAGTLLILIGTGTWWGRRRYSGKYRG
ncbi:lamin tail domain-containing protein [Neobacillus jeddahensis]|uniref:lamin tail domain-containing protein n=1 Tax=Neobacillus jeddahensis TaxID=1461580 RepID=UPI0005A8F0CD|nr:lamin tail domain-containing protein [Neobacillus jeddahensis]